MTGEHAVGRVIARPFRGEPGAFERTTGRRDLALAAARPLLPRGAARRRRPGPLGRQGRAGVRERRHRPRPPGRHQRGGDRVDRATLIDELDERPRVRQPRRDRPGLRPPRRRPGLPRARCKVIDAAVGGWLERLDPERDLLVLTADHGCDPTTPGTDHTREHVPLLARFAGARRPPPRRAVRGRRRLRAALADRERRPGAARRAVRPVRAAPAAARPRWPLAAASPAAAAAGRRRPSPRPRPAAPGRHAKRSRGGRRPDRAADEAPRRRARARRPDARLRRHRHGPAARPRPRGRAQRPRAAAARRRAATSTPPTSAAAPRRSRSARSTACAACAGTFDTTRSVTRAPHRTGLAGARTSRATRERCPVGARARAARRSAHFVVLGAAGPRRSDALMTALEAGYARMGDVLKKPRLRRRYLVVVAGGGAGARALTERIRGVESLAAISDAEVRRRGSARRVSEVVSQRLVVVWPPFSALDADGQRRIVTHELTHAALAGVTSGRTPAWLIEGIALYVSGDRRAATPRATSPARPAAAPAGADACARSRGPTRSRASAGDGQARRVRVRLGGVVLHRRPLRPQALLKLYNAFNDETLPGTPGARQPSSPRRPAHARDLARAARRRPARARTDPAA